MEQSSEAKAPEKTVWRRKKLPRNSKRVELKLRPSFYRKLQALANTDRIGRQEPIVAVIERLIDEAELPSGRRIDPYLPPRAA